MDHYGYVLQRQKYFMEALYPRYFFIKWNIAVTACHQVMWLGRGCLAANSAFSLRATYALLDPSVEIVALNPWFIRIEGPQAPIPQNRNQLDAGYQNKH
jgi:hypothetical protein